MKRGLGFFIPNATAPDGNGKERAGTEVVELRRLAAERDDFAETDIEARTDKIITTFVGFLDSCGLIAEGA